MDQVNCRAQKAWKAFHFVMRVLTKGNRSTESLAYTSLVCPVLEYGSASWDPCTKGQINALDKVQKKAAQFSNHTEDSEWETLAQRRIASLCTLFKAYCGEMAWEAKRDVLRRCCYLGGFDHVQKMRDRKQRTDIGNCSFVNWTIKTGTNYLQKR